MSQKSDCPAKPLLTDHSYNKYSQNGEDGVIETIFGAIGTVSKICIEFGAWDGFHFSNTANLWTQGWKGVLIEGDRHRFQELRANTRSYDCVCMNAYVTRDGGARLEALLEQSDIGYAVDLLSIDIDGDDYYILQSLERLRPRVIICEYNPTIPAEIDLYAEYGSDFGSSVTALTRVAGDKGYELVALTDTNCVFVVRDEAAKLSNFETRQEHIRRNSQLVYLLTSYKGDYAISRPLPYGFNFPYRGLLYGPHQRAQAKCAVMRWWYDTIKVTKNIVKRLLGRS
jgi:hypothetical protein